MKKNLLKGLAVAAFAMIAGYNVYQAHSETEGMSELMLANVEALASGAEHYMEGGVCRGAGANWTNVYCSGGYSICCWAHMDVFGKN